MSCNGEIPKSHWKSGLNLLFVWCCILSTSSSVLRKQLADILSSYTSAKIPQVQFSLRGLVKRASQSVSLSVFLFRAYGQSGSISLQWCEDGNWDVPGQTCSCQSPWSQCVWQIVTRQERTDSRLVVRRFYCHWWHCFGSFGRLSLSFFSTL